PRNSRSASWSEMKSDAQTYPRTTRSMCSICQHHPLRIVSQVVYGLITSSVRSHPPATARSQNKLDLNGMNGSASVLPRSSETNPEQSTYKSADSVFPDLSSKPATPSSPCFTSSTVS